MPMAFRTMGIGHHGTLFDGDAITQVPSYGIDYITKWVEAKPLATITKKNVRSFI